MRAATDSNCWRSLVRPLPLALLYPFFGSFSHGCRETAPLCECNKLFVLELCTKVGCGCSKGPAAVSVKHCNHLSWLSAWACIQVM